jgi:hypothetical protein
MAGADPLSFIVTVWDHTWGPEPRCDGHSAYLRTRTGQTEVTEVAIAAAALNRMLAFGRPNYVRID